MVENFQGAPPTSTATGRRERKKDLLGTGGQPVQPLLLIGRGYGSSNARVIVE